jgi:hypothetical protein
MRNDALGVHNGKEKELRKYSVQKQYNKNILFYEESLKENYSNHELHESNTGSNELCYLEINNEKSLCLSNTA